MASTNIFEFKADVKKMSLATDASLGKLMQLITRDLYKMFVERNPRDTGYSQSNWKVALDEPDETVSTPPVKGTVVVAPPIDESIVEQIDGHHDVYITNAVDYIQYLEEGTSTQAPVGWIRIAIAESESKVDKYLADVIEP